MIRSQMRSEIKSIFRKAEHPFRILRRTRMHRHTRMNERRATKQKKGESMGKGDIVGLYGEVATHQKNTENIEKTYMIK